MSNCPRSYLLMALLTLHAAAARADLLMWTPADKYTNGVDLPPDTQTQIQTTDCSTRVYAAWGKYYNFPLHQGEVEVALPGLLPCECARARTVVPSNPPVTRYSEWVAVQVCQGGTSGSCHP